MPAHLGGVAEGTERLLLGLQSPQEGKGLGVMSPCVLDLSLYLSQHSPTDCESCSVRL